MATRPFIDPVPEQDALALAIVNRLRQDLPTWTPDASDPAVYWSDDTAADRIELVGQFNASAEQNWVVTATGEGLRRKANDAGIFDFPEGETFPELRQRIYDQWDALAEGTEPHDVLRARRSNALVADASRVVDRANDRATIYVLGADGMNLEAAVRTAIQAALNVRNRPAFWLDYVVGVATITDYTVAATVTYRRRSESPETAVLANLEAVVTRLRKLDTAVYISALKEGMWAENVVDIDITSPANDLAHSPDTVYHGTAGTITFTEES